ncbi:proton channel OTOP3-like [Huso huso]|uniref:Proton channel OTOP3-like n=1 Tax=Huso huso TaxID=61971 RepID=A0ABR0Z041_HUSHU
MAGEHKEAVELNTPSVKKEGSEEKQGSPHPSKGSGWALSSGRLLSGLFALNLLFLGAALVIGGVFNPSGLRYEQSLIFIALLMGLSLLWMFWYLIRARWQPGTAPHTDHHAGTVLMKGALLLFAACSLLLHVFKMGYHFSKWECTPVMKALYPFIEALFVIVQTHLLWVHSKDCSQDQKNFTRLGLVLTLTTDLLLWFAAVTDETVHLEMEVEKEEGVLQDTYFGQSNVSRCQCGLDPACASFKKGYKVLFPFNMEYSLTAGCMLYVMWKNVGRRVEPHHPTLSGKLQLGASKIILGPFLGVVALLSGICIFIVYQVKVGSAAGRQLAFVLFYSYQLAILPAMSLCSLVGMVICKLEEKALDAGLNPTRSLDALLLVGAALGQLSISYFSLVAALTTGLSGLLQSLDLSYSLLSLNELLLQTLFIIEGLHRHPSTGEGGRVTGLEEDESCRGAGGGYGSLRGKEGTQQMNLEIKAEVASSRLNWRRRVLKEISAFLVPTNIMLWVIPAFGAHPQFENGVGKDFYGFSFWFILLNLSQPLGVFYRMHSVGGLLEVLFTG